MFKTWWHTENTSSRSGHCCSYVFPKTCRFILSLKRMLKMECKCSKSCSPRYQGQDSVSLLSKVMDRWRPFYLLYLDLLIHQFHQHHTVLHWLWERICIWDLYSNRLVHHNLCRNLNGGTNISNDSQFLCSLLPPLQDIYLWTVNGVNLFRRCQTLSQEWSGRHNADMGRTCFSFRGWMGYR